MPLERRLEQSLNQKQLWVECVTIVYESWQTLQVIQDPNQQQMVPYSARTMATDLRNNYKLRTVKVFFELKCNFGLL